jgi:cell division protein FtsB
MARGERVALKRKPQRLPLWFKVLLITIFLASASLLVNAVVGPDGLLELQRQEERFQRLRLDVLEQQGRLDLLEAEARGGEEDRPLQEKIAREDLDLVGEGEIVYRLHVGEPSSPGVGGRGTAGEREAGPADPGTVD